MISNNEIKIVDEMVDKFILKKYRDDFKQELFLIIMNMEINQLQSLIYTNKFGNYVYGILRNQYFSNQSKFYNDFKKWDLMREDFIEKNNE